MKLEKGVKGIKPREGVRISGTASPRVIVRGYSKVAIGDALVSNPSRKRWKLVMFPSSKHKKDDYKRRRSLNSRERHENEAHRNSIYMRRGI